SPRDRYSNRCPGRLDDGYSFTKSISAGAFFQYGVGATGECPGGGSCSSSLVRYGLEGAYDLVPDGTLQPWLGLGVGFDVLNFSKAGNDQTAKGFPYFDLQLGLDFKLGPQL